MMPPPWVQRFPDKEHPKSEVRAVLMLSRNDQPKEWLRVRCTDVIAIHKVMGMLTEEESYKASPKPYTRKVVTPKLRRSER